MYIVSDIIIGIIFMVLYFFPSIVAGARKHNNNLAIFMLNLLLGWTLLGWIASLIWACTNNRTKGI